MAGDTVRVRRYGRGRVVTAHATSVDIAFVDGIQRTFDPTCVRALRKAVGRKAEVADQGPNPAPPEKRAAVEGAA